MVELRKKDRDLAWPFRVLAGAAFVVIVVLTIGQIFFRFALDAPLIWSEELVRLLIVWITFIGAAVLAYDGRHLNVSIVFDKLPPRAQRFVRWLNLVLAIGFLSVLGWTSVALVRIEGMTDMGALPLTYVWIRLPATVGAALTIVFLVARFIQKRREIDGAL